MQKIMVEIDGMMCANCAKHVVEALNSLAGVKSAEASHEQKNAVVVAKDNVSLELVRGTITGLGYTVTDITTEPMEKPSFFSFFKK